MLKLKLIFSCSIYRLNSIYMIPSRTHKQMNEKVCIPKRLKMSLLERSDCAHFQECICKFSMASNSWGKYIICGTQIMFVLRWKQAITADPLEPENVLGQVLQPVATNLIQRIFSLLTFPIGNGKKIKSCEQLCRHIQTICSMCNVNWFNIFFS